MWQRVRARGLNSGRLNPESAFPAPAPPSTGFVNQVAPLYLSEMAPVNYRGGLNVCFQARTTPAC